MTRLAVYLFTFLWSVQIFPTLAAPLHSVDEKLDGPESAYTQFILSLIQNWPPKATYPSTGAGVTAGENPVLLQAVETPGNEYYIGLKQTMRVDAPLSRAEAVLDDINDYKNFFPGFDDVHIVSQDQNFVLTHWEQHIPIFFIPNVHYEMNYLIDKSHPDRAVYRYKLHKSNNLKFDDGVIVVEKDPSAPNSTLYTEYDFYDADWGILKTVSPGRIWKDSAEGLYVSDVAIKLKAEHADWKDGKVLDEAQKILDHFSVEKVIHDRVPFVQFAKSQR